MNIINTYSEDLHGLLVRQVASTLDDTLELILHYYLRGQLFPASSADAPNITNLERLRSSLEEHFTPQTGTSEKHGSNGCNTLICTAA